MTTLPAGSPDVPATPATDTATAAATGSAAGTAAPGTATSASGSGPALIYGIDDRPPLGRSLLLGAQQVLVSNVWLDALFIAGVGGLSAGLATSLVTITFLAAGLTTLVQTLRLVRLPIVEGPSSAFDAMAISAARSGSLAVASTGLIIAAAIVLLASVTGVLHRIRSVFTPAVTGTVLVLVGLLLAQFTFLEFFGGDTASPDFATPATLGLALATTVTVVVCGYLLPGGRARTVSFLVALVVGDLLALAAGRLDFAQVGRAAWFALPDPLPYGALSFDLGVTVVMTVIFLAAVAEAIGTYQAVAELTGEELTGRRLSGGVAGEAAGSMVAGFFGGFGTTAYAQNLGLMKLTRVASRHTVRIAAVMMILLAFSPKVAAVLVATPAPVVGGLFLPAAATVVFSGVSTLGRIGRDDERSALVAAVALMAGLGVPALGEPLLKALPGTLADLTSQGIVVGTVTAVVLQLLLVNAPSWRPRGTRPADRS
ncbi:solute carrier family 23 protein [Spirillospora sp. NPDC047279]|uniref:uracil-xanthine permease family protein n=1 Tax=Spirillospora sp. NPDC047279 TaxID=3155478 RepID=UPI003401A7F4